MMIVRLVVPPELDPREIIVDLLDHRHRPLVAEHRVGPLRLDRADIQRDEQRLGHQVLTAQRNLWHSVSYHVSRAHALLGRALMAPAPSCPLLQVSKRGMVLLQRGALHLPWCDAPAEP